MTCSPAAHPRWGQEDIRGQAPIKSTFEITGTIEEVRAIQAMIVDRGLLPKRLYCGGVWNCEGHLPEALSHEGTVGAHEAIEP